MLFFHPYLLLGLAGVAVPVVIHLFNRRNAREVKWGAMRFLLDSLLTRRRSLLMEEMLLLAARSLLVGCAVLAMARPFVPTGSLFPWWAVLPVGFLGIMLFGMSFALGQYRRWQLASWGACLLCLLLCVLAVLFEKRLSRGRFIGGGERDIALVIDGSSSMTMKINGETNFSRAVKEATRLVEDAPRGVAFSVIVAGAVPELLVPSPVTDRKYVLAALERAMPVQGVLQVPASLAVAAASLAQGSRVTKQVILIGDGQSVGWQTGDLEKWACLKGAFEKLPSEPQIFARFLESPSAIRNLALKDVAFSRPVVGLDREVRVDVTLANTGREAVTPKRVILSVEGQELTDRSVGQLEPGAEQVVTFRHRFKTPGAQVVGARVDVDDELSADDAMKRVLPVMRTLKVLVVDDGRAIRLLDRPGGLIALGLMPSLEALQGRQGKSRRDAAQSRFLMEPELIATGTLGLKRTLAGYAAVVLADVPSLPEAQAEQLAAFVRLGGSLLVAHGARSDAAFYNDWTSNGEAVLPLPIGACRVRPAGTAEGGLKIDPGTFRHSALALFKESGDLSDTVIDCSRQAVESNRVACVMGRLQDGSAFMAEQALGKGRVIQFFVPLDRTAGTLTARQSFLPLVQEVTAYLAQPVVAKLNIPPSRGAVVSLSSPALSQLSGNGLLAEYFRRDTPKKVLLSRVDPTLDMAWEQNSPAEGVPPDGFEVRWTGSFVPPRSGKYTFYVKADDRLSLKVGTLELEDKAEKGAEGSATFHAGERYPLEAVFSEDRGAAGVRVDVAGPDFQRARLPQEWLIPVRSEAESWADAVDTQVKGPGGRTLSAKIRYGEEGLQFRTDSPLMQGLYTVRVPEAAAGWLGHLATTNGTFALCVKENYEESKLDTLTPDELAIIVRQADVAVARRFEDLEKALLGKTFGRELWRIPAIVLFALLILETVLTRWICLQRKTGETAFETGKSSSGMTTSPQPPNSPTRQ